MKSVSGLGREFVFEFSDNVFEFNKASIPNSRYISLSLTQTKITESNFMATLLCNQFQFHTPSIIFQYPNTVGSV